MTKVPFYQVPVAGFFSPLSPMFIRGSVFLKLDKSHAAPYPPGTVAMNFSSQERVLLVERKVTGTREGWWLT